jgi:hypothetical protein
VKPCIHISGQTRKEERRLRQLYSDQAIKYEGSVEPNNQRIRNEEK